MRNVACQQSHRVAADVGHNFLAFPVGNALIDTVSGQAWSGELRPSKVIDLPHTPRTARGIGLEARAGIVAALLQESWRSR